MKIFFNVLLSILIIVLIAVLIIGFVASCNGLTIIEQIQQWLGIIVENPPVVDPTKKVSI